MRHSRFLLILMMILPWFLIPLLGRRSIKRFLPATILICCVVKINNISAKKRNWWKFYTSIHPNISGDIPFILGPYLLFSLGILKLTYGKLTLFMITNAIVHILFAFPGMKLLKRLGIVSLVQMKPIQLTFLLTIRGFLLYGFQFAIENIKKNNILSKA
ncbi:hypothetical protein BABA_05721 [Neobacillus bataviensis LMG 21833]|uniref:Uncharacterized protein n=1 Tax=Neobacillus bataviensis LMG 21833 TaxID=1117379 RepID=K6DCX0_9BACI|nr:hypothetical protein [Neobacillus bataviensis]EKN70382.1 hypothetical protein BABA_05721 [Neobacillus bataviensis LMG 21833]